MFNAARHRELDSLDARSLAHRANMPSRVPREIFSGHPARAGARRRRERKRVVRRKNCSLRSRSKVVNLVLDSLLENLLVLFVSNVATSIVGIWTGYYILSRMRLDDSKQQAQELVQQAHRQAETILKEATLLAKEDALRDRESLDQEIEQAHQQVREREQRLSRLTDSLESRSRLIAEREGKIELAQLAILDKQAELEEQALELRRLIEDQRARLHSLARLGPEDARVLVLGRVEQELAQEIGARLLKQEHTLKESAQAKAQAILATAIQRHAAGHTADTTVSVVDLPTEDLKGRLIGREGRNIRMFERATGVDLIIDDTPGLVVVSSFDPLRREVAKHALGLLIQDGRIHPGKIEEFVARAQAEIDQRLHQTGLEALQETELAGVADRLVDYLGRLKIRISYAQNVLAHSIEVAHLTGMLAAELGLDPRLGRRCGLFHDLGKAASQELAGPHTVVGAELLKRHGEPAEVVHAALGHHDDLLADRPYTVLVAAADAISASRPGARRDSLDRHIRRLEDLEAIARGFAGVDKAFAIQAGRELRVLVDGQQLSDEAAATTCHHIARAIERDRDLTGEVKVTVLRETRITELAR